MIIYGKNINMRTVTIKDAEFIYKMRQNQDKTKYLSKVIGPDQKLKDKLSKEFRSIF